jgi:hypothetical protein
MFFKLDNKVTQKNIDNQVPQSLKFLFVSLNNNLPSWAAVVQAMNWLHRGMLHPQAGRTQA